jgi:TRAP-type mannitol/chloroaromatic compound transport system substrate-binding protein
MGKKLVVFLVAVVAIVSLLIVGCAPEVAPPAEEKPTPPPAAPEVEVIKWVGQSHAGGLTQQHYSLLRVADQIRALSNGRLDIRIEIGGGIAPATKEFDAVDTGVLNCAVTCFMYWMDKFPAAGLFTMKSGGMSPMEALCWFREGGGAELAEEMIKGYKVYIIPNGGWMGTPECFLATNTELKKRGDIGKLTIRAAGDGGEILSRLGAGVVMMPAGEIFEAMERGVVDAYECSNPTLNWDLGLYEAGDYLWMSGARQPYEFNPFIVNINSWNELSDDLKAIVAEVNEAEAFRAYAECVRMDLESLAKFRDYGTKVRTLPAEVEEEYAEEARKFYAEKGAADPFVARVLKSYEEFQEAFREVWARP